MIDLVKNRMSLDAAIEAFKAESKERMRDSKRYYFAPDHDAKYHSRHSGKHGKQKSKR